MELSESEKNEAKKNGFIMLGKTGTGKSNLLNSLFSKKVAKSERTLERVTESPNIYYYKIEPNKCICLIDTPGLSDTKTIEDESIDEKHLNNIKKKIAEENIHIKGLLFLVNFQDERFDADEQKTLIKYNTVFPLKRFWKHIIILFTHYYSDPNGDNEEEMKKSRAESNKKIFSKIMEKVKNVSDEINYDDLDIQYTNLYFPTKNDKQKKNNEKYLKELKASFERLCSKDPLFSSVEIAIINNYVFKGEDNKKYIGKAEVTGFFDFNEKPIHETVKLLEWREFTKKDKGLKLECESDKIIQAVLNNEAIEHIEKDGPGYYKKLVLGGGIGGTIGVVAGLVLGAIIGGPFLPIIAVGAGVAGIVGGGGVGAGVGLLKGLSNK